MGNMSYCRMENTANDLAECYDHISDSELSRSEHKARLEIISLAVKIVQNFEFAQKEGSTDLDLKMIEEDIQNDDGEGDDEEEGDDGNEAEDEG